MRLGMIRIWVVFVVGGVVGELGKGEVGGWKGLEWGGLGEGKEVIKGEIEKEIKEKMQ